MNTARPSRAYHARAGPCARTFENLPVVDARRANRLARAAVQTLRHLVDEAGTQQIEPFLGDRLDERDAAARAGRLDQRFDVRRTRRQAQAAADAAVEDVGRRNVRSDEAAERIGDDHDDTAFAGAKRPTCPHPSIPCARAAPSSSTAATAPPPARSTTPSASTTRTSPNRSS